MVAVWRIAACGVWATALCGCAIESAPKLGGQRTKSVGLAQVQARFPVGTALDDIERVMVVNGYHCNRFGKEEQNLGCGSDRHVPGPTYVIGYNWRYIFDGHDGRLTVVEVEDPFAHYF
jgi:hypothetical protein